MSRGRGWRTAAWGCSLGQRLLELLASIGYWVVGGVRLGVASTSDCLL